MATSFWQGQHWSHCQYPGLDSAGSCLKVGALNSDVQPSTNTIAWMTASMSVAPAVHVGHFTKQLMTARRTVKTHPICILIQRQKSMTASTDDMRSKLGTLPAHAHTVSVSVSVWGLRPQRQRHAVTANTLQLPERRMLRHSLRGRAGTRSLSRLSKMSAITAKGYAAHSTRIHATIHAYLTPRTHARIVMIAVAAGVTPTAFARWT